MAVRVKIGAERVSFHMWEASGGTVQKEAGVEKRRPLMTRFGQISSDFMLCGLSSFSLVN